MLFVDGSLALLILAFWLFCLFDVITTDAAACRNLPKLVWLAIVILLPDIGSIIWLVAGHPWNTNTAGLPYKGNVGRPVARGGRTHPTQQARPTNPDDDAAFLRQISERAEQQRRAVRPPESDDGPA